MRISIMAVLIAQEHLPFIRDWCIYHLNEGFDEITLYDNTGSIGSNRKSSIFSVGKLQKSKISKGDIPYPSQLSDIEAKKELKNILSDLPVNIVDWQPKNNKGEIVHGQVEGYVDYIKKNKNRVDWTAFIDADEYLRSENNYFYKELCKYVESKKTYRIILQGIKCKHRCISKTRESFGFQRQRAKNLVKIKEVKAADIHWRWELTNPKWFKPDTHLFWFDHYNITKNIKEYQGEFGKHIHKTYVDESIKVK